jgi:hypothetical protein
MEICRLVCAVASFLLIVSVAGKVPIGNIVVIFLGKLATIA